MPAVPSGTVTFLFTDIEGSTTRWEQHPDAMRAALARHDALLHDGIAAHGGVVIVERGEGDSFFALYARPSDAVAAACALQRALAAEPWPQVVAPLRVRMALHTGEAGLWEGRDYRGAAVNRCARLRAVAHGGQVLLSRVTYELVRDQLPPGVTLRDLGEHRLKDLTRPEHIYQVLPPALPADFPPLKTLDAHRHTLPVQLTPFIGREREVAAVRERLLDPPTRLLTLTGPGGSGKTRLALQVAAAVLEAFPDGVFFVDLAPLSDPALVLPTIAQTLGVVEQAAAPLTATLQGRLRGTQTLLLLDNFEQVVEAAPQVLALLEGAAEVRLLVTSRSVLQVQGEREYPVWPLVLPDVQPLPPLDRLTQYDALRLFIARAQDVQPDFTVTTETAPAVAEICMRLDGLPLAIELAAARIRVLPPQALLRRLEHRLTLGGGGTRTRPTRQQTLRATIDWSYHLLTSDEQTLFARLGVFVGGGSLEAIEAVCTAEGPQDVLAGVESLVAKSLLRPGEGGAGEPRFVLLETLREYAQERLEASGAADAVRRRHAAYFLALAEQAAALPADRRWVLLHGVRDNLHAALRWTIAQGDAASGVRFAGALTDFWRSQGHVAEGRSALIALLALPALHDPSAAREQVLQRSAELAYRHGDLDLARAHREELLRSTRARGSAGALARALMEVGDVAREQGDIAAARTALADSLALCRTLGDRAGSGEALFGLGDLHRDEGDHEGAWAYYAEGLAIARETGDTELAGWCLLWSGMLALHRGDRAQARGLLEECRLLFGQRADKWALGEPLWFLGLLAFQEGDFRAARAWCQESFHLLEEMEMWRWIGLHLWLPAALVTRQGRPVAALRLFAAGTRAVERLPYHGAWSVIQAALAPVREQARAALGEDERAAAEGEGRAMSPERAVAYALEELGRWPVP